MSPGYGSTKGKIRLNLDKRIDKKFLGSAISYFYVSIITFSIFTSVVKKQYAFKMLFF